MNRYHEFIARKRIKPEQYGFEVADRELNVHAFDWQKRIIQWALRRGRAAIFAECGLGKTLMQLEWAAQVCKHTGGSVLIHTPCGVRHQTLREAERFAVDVPVNIANDHTEVQDGISLVNYEKLHKFDPTEFVGVVLDESSILKSSTGKVRTALIHGWSRARFRLACTATPAPNDHMELGNHAEFLGVIAATDMLNRWFVHDGGDTSKWRLRKHAQREFWDWVASWAVCVAKPSDIGGSDAGYALPELHTVRHIVELENAPALPGMLFATHGIAATSIHEEKRMSNEERCRKAASLACGNEPCIVWCDTNYEADELAKMIPDAIEVRGSDKEDAKEERLRAFSEGDARVLISKPSIAGWGMNWQHCNQIVFAGLSYSFESYYQAVRRCWRFGQKRPVYSHIVMAETESAIDSAIASKAADFDMMRAGMSEAMRDATLAEFGLDRPKQRYQRTNGITLPKWIGA